MKNFFFVVFSFILVLAALNCAPPDHVAAARLLNAFATKTVLTSATASPSPTTSFPLNISCSKDVYQMCVTGGTCTRTINITASGPSNSVAVTFNVSLNDVNGPGINVRPDQNNPLHCAFNATYSYNSTSGTLSGAGTISTCDGFECIVNGSKIPCDKLKDALQKETCQ